MKRNNIRGEPTDISAEKEAHQKQAASHGEILVAQPAKQRHPGLLSSL